MRILHVLRAPVGGLFRHVRDLVEEQAARGHEIGVLCDSVAADPLTQTRLDELARDAALGVHRTPMPRLAGPSDVSAALAARRLAFKLKADVIHGHGAKGGAYARAAAAWPGARLPAFYTPHGGSLHYAPDSATGRVFMALERWLARSTAGILFESAFSRSAYRDKVGDVACLQVVVPNGLKPDEFVAHQPRPDATDLLFIGELRHLKGVDLLIDAMAALAPQHRLTATIVGDGPDRAAFEARTQSQGLSEQITFTGARPAAEMFDTGRCLVVPSRAESFPYIVLEGAARAMPMIATNVGGIPEITVGTDMDLVAPDNAEALAAALTRYYQAPDAARDTARRLQARARDAFSVSAMTRDVLATYQAGLDRPASAQKDIETAA